MTLCNCKVYSIDTINCEQPKITNLIKKGQFEGHLFLDIDSLFLRF